MHACICPVSLWCVHVCGSSCLSKFCTVMFVECTRRRAPMETHSLYPRHDPRHAGEAPRATRGTRHIARGTHHTAMDRRGHLSSVLSLSLSLSLKQSINHGTCESCATVQPSRHEYTARSALTGGKTPPTCVSTPCGAAVWPGHANACQPRR